MDVNIYIDISFLQFDIKAIASFSCTVGVIARFVVFFLVVCISERLN